MESNRDNSSSDFINFGTYVAEEADILKPELEKEGIPVKVLYPGTNIGKELTLHARWTAYTILIRAKDCKTALEICNKLNIRAKYKIPLPKLLYTKINRYIFGIIVFAYLVIITLGTMGVLQDEILGGVLIIIIFLAIFLFLIITGYKIITRH